jgi:hypothetical protein
LAAEQNVGNAYAKLAKIYELKEDSDEAFRWANGGFACKDGASAGLMGDYYSLKKEYDKAWNCYFKQYTWTGEGAVNLAYLYSENKFRPDGITRSDVIDMLEVSARNGNSRALEILINMYSSKDTEGDTMDSNKVKQYTKLGALIGFPNQMYQWGRSLMGDDEGGYNVYKGLEWIEKSARNGYEEAIEYLLLFFNEGKYKNKEKLIEWVYFAAWRHTHSVNVYPLICKVLANEDAINELKAYLIYNIKANTEHEIDALISLISLYSSGYIKLSDDEVGLCYIRAQKEVHKANDKDEVSLLDDLLNKLQERVSLTEIETEKALKSGMVDSKGVSMQVV